MIEDMEALAGGPAVGWASGPLGAVQAARREIARQTAVEARALAAFAATRPASVDRQPGEQGAMAAERRAARPEVLADVSEWAAQELAMAVSIPTSTAEDQLARALTLVSRLPRVLAALETGLLHVGHLWPLLEKVAPIAERSVREGLERDLLAWVAGRQVTTPAQLGAKIRRECLARNVRTTARELAAALRRRGVSVRADRVDGMAVLTALLTVPEAEALLDALGRLADELQDDPAQGPPRTRQQKMADCLLDLVLRPGETRLPVVQAQLTVVAPIATLTGADQPGEIDGHPVPPEMVRALARGLDLLAGPDSTDGDSAAASADARPCAGLADADPVDADAALVAAEERWWAEVEARALRGEWGGEDDPAAEELERWWNREAELPAGGPDSGAPLPGFDCDVGPMPVDPAADPAMAPAAAPTDVATAFDTEPSWWAAADRAVNEASATQLDLERALARAHRAVQAAEIADLADRDTWDESPTARMSTAPDALAALAHATAGQRAALADLLNRTTGGGLADRPRIAVTDALTGALLALTDARELRAAAAAGRGLGPPGPTDGYRPGAVLDRFLRARDRRCRFPGCRRRVPRGGELDHNEPWPAGPTAASNLNGFCTPHHRGKHQAPEWHYDLSPDGVLTVTTPTGLTASTDPPPY
jgi:hypothetical protein